jgi:hypothetical protein
MDAWKNRVVVLTMFFLGAVFPGAAGAPLFRGCSTAVPTSAALGTLSLILLVKLRYFPGSVLSSW